MKCVICNNEFECHRSLTEVCKLLDSCECIDCLLKDNQKLPNVKYKDRFLMSVLNSCYYDEDINRVKEQIKKILVMNIL